MPRFRARAAHPFAPDRPHHKDQKNARNSGLFWCCLPSVPLCLALSPVQVLALRLLSSVLCLASTLLYIIPYLSRFQPFPTSCQGCNRQQVQPLPPRIRPTSSPTTPRPHISPPTEGRGGKQAYRAAAVSRRKLKAKFESRIFLCINS